LFEKRLKGKKFKWSTRWGRRQREGGVNKYHVGWKRRLVTWQI